MQTFSNNSSTNNKGTKLTEQELSQYFVRRTTQTGYEWNNSIQYQTILEIGTIYSAGFIKKELIGKSGASYGSDSQNWTNNKGNVLYATMPASHNLQLSEVNEFISSAIDVKAAQLTDLAKFYTGTSKAAIKTSSLINTIMRAVKAEAKSRQLIVEDFDPIPLDPALHAANPAKQQQVQAFIEWFGLNYGQQLRDLAATYSVAALTRPGGPLEGYGLYKKIETKNNIEKVTYRFYKEG